MLWPLRFRAVLRGAVLAAVSIGLCACGGGGGGGVDSPNPPNDPPASRTNWDALVWDSDNWA